MDLKDADKILSISEDLKKIGDKVFQIPELGDGH